MFLLGSIYTNSSYKVPGNIERIDYYRITVHKLPTVQVLLCTSYQRLINLRSTLSSSTGTILQQSLAYSCCINCNHRMVKNENGALG